MRPPEPTPALAAPSWDDLVAACASRGLRVRGAFHTTLDDALPDVDGAPAATLALLGNAGSSMWEAFERARAARPTLAGLDAWTLETVTALAHDLGARPVFPFEGPPYHPFQRWAQRAEPVHPSPLGMLIHPEFGLWHAYRAALLFAARIDLPPRDETPSPCATCVDRPCLGGCPVRAFSDDPSRGYDVLACVTHLRTVPDPGCMTQACLARRACPVGRAYVYVAPQRAHHMRAFRESCEQFLPERT
ncbi:hypothetical protein [Chondromyces crocatus]|uniref:4Fe-4S ferredoxin-type domain-containing protein n=1 Tax=Chondromyces crocatus TaxID=52 RepID=A0A0K1E8D4_CHOCO|nr:hypothetical protein [Chondromyces crocatus]AKT37115.1 uncharacterized protein CMC5_012450 [Chondromyces crocatus]